MADIAEKPVEVTVASKDNTDAKPAPAAEEVAPENGTTKDDLTKLENSIIRQVEYYFGDANLMRDKFLQAEIAKNPEGWVDFSVLLTFKRLAALSKDVNVIVDALIKSDEGLLEISEDHTKLRRHPERPIPERTDENRKEMMTRTVYVKGFPLDTTMESLVDFFTKFDKVEHIVMRRYLDKPTKSYKFKSSVFATFESIDQAKKFIELEKVEFGERQLLRKWQEKYLEEKQEERNKLKKKNKEKNEKQEEDKIILPTGSVFFFEGVGENVTREILRETFLKIDSELDIAYIDFSKGEKQGYVRLQGENTAQKFIEQLTENKVKLNDDMEITLRTLTEEEEKVYLEKALESMRNRRNNFNKHHKKSGGHHHYGHNRKRRGGNNDSETHEKRKKSVE